MAILRSLLIAVTRFLLVFRYKVTLEGLDQVRHLKKALILPNHPAYVDPAIVVTHLHNALHPRPMLFAEIFDNPFLGWMPKV